MLVQTLSSGTLIYYSAQELQETGLAMDEMDQATALMLVRKALAPGKQPLPTYPELQLFFSKEELLIVLRSFLAEESHFSLNSCTSS